MASVVGERGQITIEKTLRDRLGVHPHDVAVQWIEDGRLVVAFLPAPHRRSLLGILKPRPEKPILDWEEVREQVEESIAEEAMW